MPILQLEVLVFFLFRSFIFPLACFSSFDILHYKKLILVCFSMCLFCLVRMRITSSVYLSMRPLWAGPNNNLIKGSGPPVHGRKSWILWRKGRRKEANTFPFFPLPKCPFQWALRQPQKIPVAFLVKIFNKIKIGKIMFEIWAFSTK